MTLFDKPDYHAARERRQAEEADYTRMMGEYLARTLEEAGQGKEDRAGGIFDAVGRAQLAKEGKARE